MKPDLDRYFYEKGYDECTKRVFEIISERFNISSIDEIDDLNDYINPDEYMNRAAGLIHSGFSSEWTSYLAHDDFSERRIKEAYEQSPRKKEDLELFISSFKKSDVFDRCLRGIITGYAENPLHLIRVNENDDIVEAALDYEKNWNDTIAEGMTEAWTECYLSDFARGDYADLYARIYESFKIRGYSVQESIDAADLLSVLDQSEYYPRTELAKYDEYERDQIAIAFAEIIASNNAINEDEEEYYSIYARLFKEAHNSDSEVLMNTLTNNSIEEYALNHNEYYYNTYR